MLVVIVDGDLKRVKYRRIYTNGNLEGSEVVEVYSGTIPISWGRCTHMTGDLFNFNW